MIYYTCITNNYCPLPVVKNRRDDDVFVCFTDGTVEPQDGWELRPIKYKSDCPVRMSRHPKIMFHEYFDEPCVYMDASRVAIVCDTIFYNVSEDLTQDDVPIIMEHPDQHNYIEECFEYYVRNWVKTEELVEFTKELREKKYNFKNHETFLMTLLWRRPTEETIAWSKLWWELYEKCGPRDQISAAVSLKMSGIDFTPRPCLDLIDSFCWYKDFWYGYDASWSGSYSVENTDQYEWESFCKLLWKITKVDYKKNLHPDKFQYFETVGYSEILEDLRDQGVKGEWYDFIAHNMHLEYVDQTRQRDGYKFTVYTCITNDYDRIPPEHYYDPDVRYVCFHDGTLSEYPEPWEFIDVRKYTDLTCPRRLSAFPKINPHKLFEAGTHTVWIDAPYVMTEEFVRTSEMIFPTTVTTMEHCYEFSYYDEILEGFLCNFFTMEDAMELTKALASGEDGEYNFKQYGSPCCTMIWRTCWHPTTDPAFAKFCDLWWKYSLIGPSRDQNSFDAARQFSGIEVNRIYNKPPSTIVAGVDLKFDKKNKYRKKWHPKYGGVEQWRHRDELLMKMREYVKLSPRIYAKHEHITMMDWNKAFQDNNTRTEYCKVSPTIKNFARQNQLWETNVSVKEEKRRTLQQIIWQNANTKDEQKDASKRQHVLDQLSFVNRHVQSEFTTKGIQLRKR